MSKDMNQPDAQQRAGGATENDARRPEAHQGERRPGAQPHAGDASEAGTQEGPSSDDARAEKPEGMEETLRAQLEQANREALLAQAELENFRKRTRRDQEEQLKFAITPLAKDLLEVVDNLNRALEAGGDDVASLRSGVEMVRSQLVGALEKHGVRNIPAVGELFDPNYHEAIGQMPSEEHPEGVVAHQALPGYQLHNRVIRPPQVLVSSGPPQESQE